MRIPAKTMICSGPGGKEEYIMKRKRIIGIMVVTLLLAAMVTGCSKYRSKYFAVGFAHTNTSGTALMSFYKFDGRMVFTLKNKQDGVIEYNGELMKGSLTVYYDCDGSKVELFKLSAGESVNSKLENLPKGEMYIIVDTDGECENGDIEFRVKKK